MGSNAQQFCLKWNNHQANMLSVFDRLFSNKSLVDVTIGCEGKQVKAHKVVLSACSPFFESLFIENPCKHPIVILKDIRYADLRALVEFMYKGEVNVVQEQLPTLLKTAEALKIKGLAEVTGDKSETDKPSACVTPRPDSPSRRKRHRVRRKSTDSGAGGGGGHSDSEESVPKASRTEVQDDSSMDGATSLDDGSQTSLQPPSSHPHNNKETQQASNVQNATSTVNTSSSSIERNNSGNTDNHRSDKDRSTNGPNSNSNKDTDFEPTRLLEASMTTDHGNDNSQHDMSTTGPDNSLIPEGLDIKPIITLEEGGATPAGAIVPASGASSLSTGTDAALSSLFPTGTGATALPGTSYQASPQSHEPIDFANLDRSDISHDATHKCLEYLKNSDVEIVRSNINNETEVYDYDVYNIVERPLGGQFDDAEEDDNVFDENEQQIDVVKCDEQPVLIPQLPSQFEFTFKPITSQEEIKTNLDAVGEVSARDQAISADDQARFAHDQGIPADDQAIPADDQAIPADDQAIPADDQARFADDQAIPADDQARFADDEVIAADDESRFADDQVIPADDRARFADDQAIPADDQARFADDQAIPADDQARFADDEVISADDESRFADDQAIPADDQVRFAYDRVISADDQAKFADDPASPADDQVISADDQARFADDELRFADDQAIPADDQAIPADDQAIPADDQAIPADDQAKFADDPASPADDQVISAVDQVRFSDDQARFSDDQARFSDDQARFSDDQARFADDQAIPVDYQAIPADDQARFADDQARFADDQVISAGEQVISADHGVRFADDGASSAGDQAISVEDKVLSGGDDVKEEKGQFADVETSLQTTEIFSDENSAQNIKPYVLAPRASFFSRAKGRAPVPKRVFKPKK